MAKNYIKETEDGKFLVRVILGEENVRRFNDGKAVYKSDCDGDYKEWKFNTEAEADAYVQGLDDRDGWMDSHVLFNDEKCKIYKEYFRR